MQPCDHNGTSLCGHTTWQAMLELWTVWTRPFMIGTLCRYTHRSTPSVKTTARTTSVPLLPGAIVVPIQDVVESEKPTSKEHRRHIKK
ncbi:uncharacterized protein ARMOST_18846 [Armillaria ostoyae]|uniref:Uncharacterized protein n=1 Tax=Armillaria ostoyae TaxID=47428 RepID=A0A284S2W6_ARMOS|nr:uncharacterized protein ARMOST_18846 [Armillaria ostoyae]